MRYIRIGKHYKHFKGNIYKVKYISIPRFDFTPPQDAEVIYTLSTDDGKEVIKCYLVGDEVFHDTNISDEMLVIYHSITNLKCIWARRLSEFSETVKRDGEKVQYRFTEVILHGR